MAIKLKKKRCPVCSQIVGKNQNLFYNHYFFCSSCGSYWSDDLPKVIYRKKYYSREKNGWWMKLIDRLSFFDRYRTLNLKKDDRILEVGFGQGKFLTNLHKLGYDVAGVEQSEYAIKNLKLELMITDVYRDISLIKDNSVDIVVMYHVLEHIEEPIVFINNIKKKLRQNGRIVVRVPNVNSWEFHLAGRNWYHLDFPHHPILFSDTGVVELFKNSGLKNIKVKKMMLEYRQVIGYSLLTYFDVHLPVFLLICFEFLSIPILWIVSALAAQHGVVEVEGRVDNSSNSKISSKDAE